MFETNFDFDYNRFKLNAIIDQFHHEEDELRLNLIDHLEKLYDELVPQDVKQKVEEEILAEHNRQWQNDNCFALIHMHNVDDEECFMTAKGIHSLYDAAKLYHDDLTGEVNEYSIDSLLLYLDSYDYLDESVFNVLSDMQAYDNRISCEVHYDFEVGTLEMRSSDGTMVAYDMNYLSDLIERVESSKMSEAEKRNAFNDEIENYLNQCDGEGQGEGSTMHL